MSKSKGNVVDPIEVGNKSGVEILRLWSVYEDYGQDLSCGQTELDRVTETYRKIRNTLRFMLGATSDFDSSHDMVPYEKMPELDQWALGKLYELNKKITAAYEEYSFYKVYHALNTFFTVEISATYLDVLKDRLYTWKADGLERRSSQTVIYLMTDQLVRLMAPILSFLSEEVYSYMKIDKKAESVFLLNFPIADEKWNNSNLMKKFDELVKIRGDVQKELEQLRTNKTIGSSLEAKVVITAEEPTFSILKSFQGLREYLIVSKVELVQGAFAIQAKKADGEKCVRCWTYSESISKNEKTLGICPKCVEALS